VAARQGLLILPDHIHLGERAGAVLADLVEVFVRESFHAVGEQHTQGGLVPGPILVDRPGAH